MYFFYFYPVGVDLERRRTPWLTYSLALVMAGLFLWTRYFPEALDIAPYALIFVPGNGAPWTVITAIFLHGGWLHLVGNLVYLLVLAPVLEDRLGRLRLLHYFLLLGACGNVVHGLGSIQGWLGNGAVGVMGASGAISGLLAFALVRFYYARLALAYWVFTPLQGVNRAGRAHLPLPVAVLLWLLLQVIHTLVSTESGSAVSYGAHFGGFGLGLILALALGYRRLARAESRFARGQRYLNQGQAHAAAGAFLEYLEMAPDDHEGHVYLARARRMAGQSGAARQDYLRAFRQAVSRGDISQALDVYQEVRRGNACFGLPPEDLARAAFLMEKQLDFQGAVEAYIDLYNLFPSDERAELALVRAIMLFRSQLRDRRQARRWLEVAWRELPPGVWRDFLASEFKLDRIPHEGEAAGGTGMRPEPAV